MQDRDREATGVVRLVVVVQIKYHRQTVDQSEMSESEYTDRDERKKESAPPDLRRRAKRTKRRIHRG
jgi:hypothetical protein